MPPNEVDSGCVYLRLLVSACVCSFVMFMVSVADCRNLVRPEGLREHVKWQSNRAASQSIQVEGT